MDEHSLIRAAQKGDLDAFNALVLTYQDHLFGIALRVTTDEDAAADAVQEALISAFRHIAAFRGGCFRSWLARITVNACYDELRRKSRRPSQPLERIARDGQEIDLNDWLYDPAPGTEYQVETSELDGAIRAALGSLSPLYRAAVVLVDVEGYSYEEAAREAAQQRKFSFSLNAPKNETPGETKFTTNYIIDNVIHTTLQVERK